MSQRSGLGRGLAAILPSGFTNGSRGGNTHGRGVVRVNAVSEDLAASVATTDSGLALIYRVLDDLVAQFNLEDAAIVLEEHSMGRQVFCAGRRPLHRGDEELLTAQPGLYTQPKVDDQSFDRNLFLSLCALALRLDAIRYDAWHDPLTGLYDRRSFDRLLEEAVARSNRYGWRFTLVLLDLDHFKLVNDRSGHQAGDAVLRDLGERFRRALRFGDNAGRVGGDEFAMILPNTEPALVPALLDRVRNADGVERECPRFSFGVAQCPEDASDPEQLVRVADLRLYEAKDES